MTETSRDQRIAEAFVAVAHTLTEGFDVIELLHTLVSECVGLLDVDAGGLLLADPSGDLQLVASTSEQAQLVEVMQLSAGAGPCVDCFRSGVAVTVADIAEQHDRWPVFTDAALREGFTAMFATPLRLRGQTLGAMNLFSRKLGGPSSQDAILAQALADIATIGILNERSLRESHLLADQLQFALESRVIIEQAKGVLAVVATLDMDHAFIALRDYARSHRMTLRDVAQQVVERKLDGIIHGTLRSNAETADSAVES